MCLFAAEHKASLNSVLAALRHSLTDIGGDAYGTSGSATADIKVFARPRAETVGLAGEERDDEDDDDDDDGVGGAGGMARAGVDDSFADDEVGLGPAPH